MRKIRQSSKLIQILLLENRKKPKLKLNYFKYYVNKLKKKHSKIYILKCDIKKYFYNIDHEILLEKLKNIVLDDELYLLIENIVKSTNEHEINSIIEEVVSEEINRLKKMPGNQEHFLEELSRMPRYKQGKGLPIGNMISQILALFYLNDLDHYIKEQLNIKYHIRYMDDFLLFHYDKEYLKECWKKIDKYLGNLKLSLNHKTQIYNLNKGVNFLGYRFQLKSKKLVINASSKTKKKIIKRLRYLRKKVKNKYLVSKISYKGYFDIVSKNNYQKIIRTVEK